MQVIDILIHVLPHSDRNFMNLAKFDIEWEEWRKERKWKKIREGTTCSMYLTSHSVSSNLRGEQHFCSWVDRGGPL